MRAEKLIVWLPAAVGAALLVVTKVDLYQFQNQSIEIRTMLLREMPIVVIGLFISAMVLVSSVYWIAKRRWLLAASAVLSPTVFVLCFGIGGAMGGAYLNAT